MKNYILLFFLGSFVFSSCEDVIDLNLATTEPRLVIQGNIYDEPGPYIVTLSQTVDFDASSVYPPVTGALVIISDNLGSTDTLVESSAGRYITSTLAGEPGNSYTLTVAIGDDLYSAVSTMPYAVTPDSVYLEENTFDGEKQVGVSFYDPIDTVNYYRLIQTKNSKPIEGFYTANDELFDGQKMSYSFQGDGPGESDDPIVDGDTITVWLESVDKAVYNYFRTAGGDMIQSSTPANPISNISNGAMGYFKASAIRSNSLIAQ